MKPAQIVAAGKKYVAEKSREYSESNPTPKDSKTKVNDPPPGMERKWVNAFLLAYNLHESFVEAILHEEK